MRGFSVVFQRQLWKVLPSLLCSIMLSLWQQKANDGFGRNLKEVFAQMSWWRKVCFKLIYDVQCVFVATNLGLLFGFLCHCGEYEFGENNHSSNLQPELRRAWWGCMAFATTWRIIPFTEWKITMASKSPNWGCSLYKWPKWLINGGY